MTTSQTKGTSLSSPTKSIVFRVRGLTAVDGGDGLQPGSALSSAIKSRLISDEVSQIQTSVAIISSCYDAGKKVGLVAFRGAVPSFLSTVFKNPLQEIQIEVGEDDVTFDCNFFGFTQLYNVKAPVLADVIAITGLDGHAYGSWRGKGDLSRMWLRDFLSQDLPQCRVLTYGYNSKLTGKSRGLERILDYGRGFLEEIKQVRTTDEEMRRPLFFIAHSFGGLILAHSLVKAVLSADSAKELVYHATYAILFFGTPHRGLSVDDIRGLLSDHDHPRHGLLDQIKHNSDAVIDQLGDFKNIIQDRKIVSFYEAEQTPQLTNDNAAGRWQRTGSFATAVGPDSALLNLPDHMEEKIPLSSDHSMMVKFDSKDNKGYQIAISRLRKFAEEASSTVATRLSLHTLPEQRGHKGARETPNDSVTLADDTVASKPPSCCRDRPEASFSQNDLESLASTAYELFTSLKVRASSTDGTLKDVEQPLYSFRCALIHLTSNLDLVLSGPEPAEKLHAMAMKFARTLKALHKFVDHESEDIDINAMRNDLKSHSAYAQKLLDTVLT
ncbi:inversin o89019 [Diplodia corticola]|uniref:Inversin o89019 n=1 Tax=Diplodia corticola TaxID=236234 RepID=A0A1J9S0E5_9PEZI|nr:inversin o89019 [Diplodia corticola]OJD33149.1 inversin o89019 [Diplodia corticola]